MLVSAGVDRVGLPGGPAYDWHGLKRTSSPVALLQHTLSGTGRLRTGGVTHTLAAGMSFVVTIPHDHRYWAMPGEPWHFFWLMLQGEQALLCFNEAIRMQGSVLAPSQGTPRVELARTRLISAAANTVTQILDDAARDVWDVSAKAYDLSMKLMAYAEAAGETSARLQEPESIRRASRRVRQGGPPWPSVEELADIAGLSRSHFTRRFTLAHGVSPQQYVLRRRLRAAATLVGQTDMPLKAVAAECGFFDVRHLSRSFAKRYGQTPAALRSLVDTPRG